jgi:hypothetical protein
MRFDDITKEQYDMLMSLKNKNRMEQDEIIGGIENGRAGFDLW